MVDEDVGQVEELGHQLLDVRRRVRARVVRPGWSVERAIRILTLPLEPQLSPSPSPYPYPYHYPYPYPYHYPYPYP